MRKREKKEGIERKKKGPNIGIGRGLRYMRKKLGMVEIFPLHMIIK